MIKTHRGGGWRITATLLTASVGTLCWANLVPIENTARLLNGLAADTHATVWAATPNLTMTTNGMVCVNDNLPASAALPIPRVFGTLRVSGELYPAGAGFVSLALGRPGLGRDFWRQLDLMVYVRDSGGWAVTGGSNAKVKIAGGTAADYGGWPEGGSVPVELAFDAVSNRLSVIIAGCRVLDGLELPADAKPDAPPTAAGFRFQEPVKAGGPSLCGFAVQTSASVTSGLSPLAGDDFFLVPNRPITLRWRAASVVPGSALNYEIEGYWGDRLATGVALVSTTGIVSAEVTMPTGFGELRFLANGEAFGLVALPERAGKPDPYFGMDAGLTWLVADPALRASYIRLMKRMGIGIARERLNWSTVNPSPDKWNWDLAYRPHDSVRQLYDDADLPIVDAVWGQAKHLGIATGVPYPQDLAAGMRTWRAIADRYRANWAGVEIWNEPDLIPIPADRYAPTAKMVAWTQAMRGVTAPVIGGVFAGASPGYMRVCATNGLLEVCDAISFHNYDSAADLEGVVIRFRNWLKDGGREALPLWCTEAGLPWGPGTGRAPMARDALSALSIAGKAAEGRALGLACYMPFCLPPWRHGTGDNFGITDAFGTPLRSMAAYAQVIAALSGKDYVGDLDVSGAAPARVFGDRRGLVAVVLAPDGATGAAVRVAAPVVRVEGIDGRALALGPEGAVPVPDGLAYVWLTSAARGQVKADTPAARLWALGRQPPTPRAAASPIILQNISDLSHCRYSAQRYLLDEAAAQALPLAIQAWNLADAPATVTLRLILPGGVEVADATRTIEIPALGNTTATWTVDARRALDVAEVRFVTVTATGTDGVAILPLAMPFMVEGGLQTHLARHAIQDRLPVEDLTRWKPFLADGGLFNTSATGTVFRFDCTFPSASLWCFPSFAPPLRLDPEHHTGLLLRARILKPARHVGMMLRYNAQRPGFSVSDMLPPDGEWHVVYLPFGEFTPEPGNPELQNAVLKLNQVAAVSIGFVANQTDGAMEISDLIAVGPGPR